MVTRISRPSTPDPDEPQEKPVHLMHVERDGDTLTVTGGQHADGTRVEEVRTYEIGSPSLRDIIGEPPTA